MRVRRASQASVDVVWLLKKAKDMERGVAWRQSWAVSETLC